MFHACVIMPSPDGEMIVTETCGLRKTIPRALWEEGNCVVDRVVGVCGGSWADFSARVETLRERFSGETFGSVVAE